MSVYSAFVVRPFGPKDGFDFDRVELELIRPALQRLKERHGIEVEGGTTGEIVKQGNIRTDMFRLLVTSDIVIADVSIHNANVFYELGIRHGLQQRHTVLMRSAGDERSKYPFDLQTDRYFLYDRADLAAGVDALVDVLRTSLADSAKDSPVFLQLPRLEPHSRAELTPPPSEFEDEVRLAVSTRAYGKLRLLTHELQRMSWRCEGLRLVGQAQFQLTAYAGARVTFEALRATEPDNLLANQRLGTIYQHLAKAAPVAEEKARLLSLSDQAIDQALALAKTPDDRAEALALRGSNAKARWIDECSDVPAGAGLCEAALRSPHLGRALDAYLGAMREQLDRHYPAINALALLKCQAALAAKAAAVWEAGFDDAADAARDLQYRLRTADRAAAMLELALGRDPVLGAPSGLDAWAHSSRADLTLITRPGMGEAVRTAYRKALADADLFTLDAARRNLELFRRLELFEPNTSTALAELAGIQRDREPTPPQRVVLFTGHMVDRPGRTPPRFPATAQAEGTARRLIVEALAAEAADGPIALGIAGGACGGDILFHEACAAALIPRRLMLALPPERFQVTSVQHAGGQWVERYTALREQVAPVVLQDSEQMPRWLADQGGYDLWQRNNLWMMFSALTYQARHVTLLALYNPELDADGVGGTRHLLDQALEHHFKVVTLDARALLA